MKKLNLNTLVSRSALRFQAKASAFSRSQRSRFLSKLTDEKGMGTVEIVLILVVLISLVLIFKSNITTLMGKIMKQINQSATSVWA